MIEAGWATVAVVGTHFVVARDERAVEVSVQRGEVLVRGERVVGRERHLVAGQSLRVEGEPLPASAELPTHDREAPAEVDEQGSEPVPARPEIPVVSAQSNRGSRTASHQRASTDTITPIVVGAAEVVPDAQSITELLERADAARAAGNPRAAADQLETLIAAHASDPRASVAAFTLARLQLDVLDEPGRAIETLERALALGLPAAMEEDARARTIEALSRDGRAAAARAAAARFEQELPHSARLPEVRRWAPLEER